MSNLLNFEEFRNRMLASEPMVLGSGIDLASTDLGVTSKRTEIEVPRFKKPIKRRLKEWFDRH